ncbi:VOC family protein [Radiobacillus deserti]|uniref:VOC family protein n=1 Tax=Radiobacillus deserti TaxID=2594883 RepID=A0A516KIE1_9BACI|nr:VOC family protein [Radiobacillus deserti]QDP41116.1 VOC family protein [Radiobacillus deserti]
MISKLGQVMVYVLDQEKAVRFWTEKVGFHLVSEQSMDNGMRWFELAPSEQSDTTIVLHDKDLVAKMSPELHLGTPSLMFYTQDIKKLYQDFKDKDIHVGELVEMPTGRVFNFSDEEDNYFAVMETI